MNEMPAASGVGESDITEKDATAVDMIIFAVVYSGKIADIGARILAKK